MFHDEIINNAKKLNDEIRRPKTLIAYKKIDSS